MTGMSESTIHVVKPVVFRTSLADAMIVKSARSGINISHREESRGDLILRKGCDCEYAESFLYVNVR